MTSIPIGVNLFEFYRLFFHSNSKDHQKNDQMAHLNIVVRFKDNLGYCYFECIRTGVYMMLSKHLRVFCLLWQLGIDQSHCWTDDMLQVAWRFQEHLKYPVNRRSHEPHFESWNILYKFMLPLYICVWVCPIVNL